MLRIKKILYFCNLHESGGLVYKNSKYAYFALVYEINCNYKLTGFPLVRE